jgi:predicted DNA-binding protein with PD1-like motif
MHSFRFTPGPIHLFRLPRDADLYEEISRFASEHGITAATVTFLGAVQRASLRYYDQEARQYQDFVIEHALEVVSGVGNVTLLNGEPFLHIHAAFTDEFGRGHGGHVNTGTVVFAIEVTVQELDGDAPVRLPDLASGLSLWGPAAP